MAFRSWWLLLLIIGSCSTRPEQGKGLASSAVEFSATGNASKGKALYGTCATCHGDKAQGNLQLRAPALVNNESWYLYRQLINFRKEIRGGSPADTLGFQMAAMAKTLPDSNAVADVVAYIGSLPTTLPHGLITGDVKKGERTYQSVCGSCHGQGGKGNKMMNAPRLSGLDERYMKTQVLKFKNSVRGAHPEDVYGAQMKPMADLLRDAQALDDVVDYILSVNQADSTKRE